MQDAVVVVHVLEEALDQGVRVWSWRNGAESLMDLFRYLCWRVATSDNLHFCRDVAGNVLRGCSVANRLHIYNLSIRASFSVTRFIISGGYYSLFKSVIELII